MIFNATGNLCRHHRTTTTLGLVAAVGCLAISGPTATPAAAQSSNSGQGWSTHVWPSGSAAFPSPAPAAPAPSVAPSAAPSFAPAPALEAAPELPPPQYLGALSKKRGDDTTGQPTKINSKDDLFLPGPQYDRAYDSKSQVDIYGAKSNVEAPRPAIELGRQQYTSGQYDKSSTILGELNPLLPGLSVYGDWRSAVAYNSNAGKDIAQVATRLNLDVDLKLTATERIHAFFTPLQRGAQFTRYEFGGGDGDRKASFEFDANPQTLFFEGDFGSLYSGFTGKDATIDVPFVVGLYPLFLQNGIWANDAILGGAVTLPAKNSAKLGLPNYDITFFAALDNVDNAGILGAGQNSNANVYGVTTFIDAFKGYIEAGYGVLQGRDELDGQVTHFLTASYSRRYLNTISNSTRVFGNFGNGVNDDGFAIISENSLITGGLSTVVPYANFFVGFGNPQPLVDGFNAGILKNVGINFETDALTGFPKLNDTANDTYGGAIGITYLFGQDLGQQFTVEAAMVQPFNDSTIPTQYGLGVRYQIALTRAWLLRADATYQFIEDGEDNFGVRLELRRKF